MSSVEYIYTAVEPRVRGGYVAQLKDAVEQVQAFFAQKNAKIIRQTIFFRHHEVADDILALLQQYYQGKDLPISSLVSQAPANEKVLVSIEAEGIIGDVEVVYQDMQSTKVSHDEVTWLYTDYSAAHDQYQPKNAYDATEHALNVNKDLLTHENVGLDQVFRTWFYMGNIVADDKASPTHIQRYKELNRARSDVFGDVSFLRDFTPNTIQHDVYPASTGIGMSGLDVGLSTAALRTNRKDVRTLALENPRQTAAFEYGQHYSPESPKFARAMAVAYDDRASIYISGTASITASETQHIGDAAKQTEETLLNIAALIDSENLKAHGLPKFGAKLSDLNVVRAYIKNAEDYETVQQICSQQLGDIPVIYSIGDVCRDDLLVELEAIAHIRKQ